MLRHFFKPPDASPDGSGFCPGEVPARSDSLTNTIHVMACTSYLLLSIMSMTAAVPDITPIHTASSRSPQFMKGKSPIARVTDPNATTTRKIIVTMSALSWYISF